VEGKTKRVSFSLSLLPLIFPNTCLHLLCLVLFVLGYGWKRLDFDTCNVIIEVDILSSGMLQFIFRLIHVYDIINNHFLISYLVHTCCSLVWYLDT
jgi:hypothetical protein